MKFFVLILISIYQKFVSPFLGSSLGGSCRFSPSCSEYSYKAIDKYGLYKGLKLSLGRLSRCHPFTKPSFDPIP